MDASYKVGLPLDQQSFVSNQTLTSGEQLELFAEHAEMDDRLKIAGLDHLTDSAFNALEALKKLLATTDYEGNAPSEEITTKTFGRITPPRLQIKKSEYFEAYGLKKDGTKGYTGSDKLRRAVQGLLDLTYTQHLLIRQKVWVGEGKDRTRLNNIIRIHSPLITIIEGYELLTDPEADAVEAGKTIDIDSRLIIELSPIFVLGLDNYFVLRRYDKKDTIKALAKSTAVSQKLYRLTNWLEQIDKPTLTVSAHILADKSGYNSLVKKRKPTELAQKLSALLDLAKEGHWLLSWTLKSQRLYQLELNPDLCSRVKTKNK